MTGTELANLAVPGCDRCSYVMKREGQREDSSLGSVQTGLEHCRPESVSDLLRSAMKWLLGQDSSATLEPDDPPGPVCCGEIKYEMKTNPCNKTDGCSSIDSGFLVRHKAARLGLENAVKSLFYRSSANAKIRSVEILASP